MIENFKMMFIILSIILVFISIVFIFYSISKFSNDKYRSVIIPNQTVSDGFIDDKKNKRKSNNSKNESFKMKLLGFAEKKGIIAKIEDWLIQGGQEGKGIDYLFKNFFKFLLYGIVLAICAYLIFHNIFVSLAIIIISMLILPLDMFGNIQDRRNAFRRDFPYFLQTLAFVLANGSNLASAFQEVVYKQSDGVLKDVMTDVLVEQRSNGGDFSKAFSLISKKIKIDETKEFVDIIQNNLDKGIAVSETFTSQSKTIERFVLNKKIKKIKSISNKILIPILILIVSVVLLFI